MNKRSVKRHRDVVERINTLIKVGISDREIAKLVEISQSLVWYYRKSKRVLPGNPYTKSNNYVIKMFGVGIDELKRQLEERGALTRIAERRGVTRQGIASNVHNLFGKGVRELRKENLRK